MTKFTFLHEYGAPEHAIGLSRLLRDELNTELAYREFSVLKGFAKGVAYKDKEKMISSFKSMLWIFAKSVGYKRKEKIVLGIVPFDLRVIFLLPMLLMNEVYWFNSWPYWGGGRYPKRSGVALRFLWEKVFFRIVNSAFFVTDYAKRNFIGKYGRVFPIDVVWHSYDERIFFQKNRSKTSTGGLSVGFVGRLEESKGVSIYLDIVRRLAGSGFRFSVVGNGPKADCVREFAANNPKSLRYLGRLSRQQVAEYFKSIDVLLLPSLKQPDWEEVFGMVIIEAMACGVVPITTDHPGPKEILAEHEKFFFSEAEYLEAAVDRLRGYSESNIELESDSAKAVLIAGRYSSSNIKNRWKRLLVKRT